MKDKKQDKKNRIVEAAARVFAGQGLAGSTMARVAEEAGVGKGTLYEYFPSKDDLFFAVFTWYCDQIAQKARLDAGVLGQPASEKLLALGESVMEAGLSMGEMYTLSLEFWAAAAQPGQRERFKQTLKNMYADFRLIVAAIIEEGVQRGEFASGVEATAVASVLVGAWDAVLLQAWLDQAVQPLEAARAFSRVMLTGLQKPTP